MCANTSTECETHPWKSRQSMYDVCRAGGGHWTGLFFYSVITILIVIIIVLSALQSIHSPCQLSDVCLAGWMVRANGVGRVGVCADLLISKMCTKRCPDNNLYQLGLCLFTVWLPELTCHLLTDCDRALGGVVDVDHRKGTSTLVCKC